MSKRRTVIVLLALVLTSSNPALAQDDAAQEAQQAESQRELEAQQAEVQRARAEMEQARRQLEEAARTIAQVQVLPDLDNLHADLEHLYVDLHGLGNRARIGASVVDAEQGALVTQVTSDSGAEAAGLKVGDVIQSVNGTSVSTAGERPTATLREAIRNVEPGETVALVVERAGRTLDLEVETERGFGYTVFSTPLDGQWVSGQWADADAPGPAPVVISSPGDRVFTSWVFASSPWGDMELVAITEGLGRYFETSEGLLVVRAPQDDAIDIRDGDVILSISGRAPNSPEHAVRILSSFEPGETVELSLMRDGRRETVSYEVPERSAAFWQRSIAPGSAAPAPIPPPPVPTPD